MRIRELVVSLAEVLLDRRNRRTEIRSPTVVAILITTWLLALTPVSDAADSPRLEFTRMVAHWDGYDSPEYLPFIEDIRPDIAQVGFYGAHFWSLAHTPQ